MSDEESREAVAGHQADRRPVIIMNTSSTCSLARMIISVDLLC